MDAVGIKAVQGWAAKFARVQLHSNNGFYDFLLRVCRLIYDAGVLDQETGHLKFRDFERDDKAMAALFERFLLNFYRREQGECKAWSEGLKWHATFGEPQDLDYLPSMRTDVSLESPTRKIVIDAKYYRQALQGHFGKDSVRSGHLYQLFAYSKNLQCLGGANQDAEGILLYPLVDMPLDLRFTIQGHQVRVATMDLSQDWQHIHQALLQLIKPVGSARLAEPVAL